MVCVGKWHKIETFVQNKHVVFCMALGVHMNFFCMTFGVHMMFGVASELRVEIMHSNSNSKARRSISGVLPSW